MLIHGKPFDEIIEKDLQALIDGNVAEGKQIEYKLTLPNNSDKDKKEFLADISSFANSVGGYIFYGISEDNGLPVELIGLKDVDPDGQVLRLENLLRDAIAPRIPGLTIRAIPLETSDYIIAIMIPRSWASPHMVIFASVSRFFARNSAGKYPLDVFELRAAFTASTLETDRIRNFHSDRLRKIISGDMPVKIIDGPKAVLHLIPVGVLGAGTHHDLKEFQLSNNREMLAPIYADHGSNFRFNFDGVITFERYARSELPVSYLQLFRNGIIESVTTTLFNTEQSPLSIYSQVFEKELINALTRFFKITDKLEIEPPHFIMLSLLNVQGYNLPAKSRIVGYGANIIDRNDLIVPEVLVEDIKLPPHTILRPLFDAVWNAAGQPQSPFYDEDGNWNPE